MNKINEMNEWMKERLNEGTKWNENKWSEINNCMNKCNEMTD